MHTTLTKTPIKLKGTEWTVTEMLPISLSGPLTDIKLGNVRIHDDGKLERRIGWKARRIENHWDVMRDGERRIDGRLLADNEAFPFMTDDAENAAVVEFITNWLDAEFEVKSSPKPAPQAPAPTGITRPAMPEQAAAPRIPPVPPAPPAKKIESPKSLADTVAEKVCATYEGMTVAEMRDSKKRGLFTEARQIIVYLLCELAEKNRVILQAIGAASTGTSLIYTNHRKIAGLIVTDDTLRAKVNPLRIACGLAPVGKVEGEAAKHPEQPVGPALGNLAAGQSVAPSTPHSQNGNGLVGRITSLVSEVAFIPVLVGSGSLTLGLGPARIARAYLLFDLYRELISKRTPSKTPPSVDEVETQVVQALEQIRQSDSEVERIVCEVKKRLASETAP